MVAELLGHLDVPQGALDHRLGAGEAVLVDQVFLQAARVDADPHRDALVARLADDLLEPLLAADIAGVDPDLVDRRPARRRDRVQAGQRHPVVVVDVGDQGNVDPVADQLGGLDVLLLGDGDADDLAARFFEPVDLASVCVDVERVGRRHRLDPDRVDRRRPCGRPHRLRASCAVGSSSSRPSIFVLVLRGSTNCAIVPLASNA